MADTSTLGGSRAATAVVYKGPEVFHLDTISLPELGAGELLVEIEMAGVDGSELHMFRGEFDHLNKRAPLIFGDEIIGRVVATGSPSERDVAVGDRVTVEARWPCAGCLMCDRGQYYLCENNPNREGYGQISMSKAPGLWGGYATHVFVPKAALVYRVPDELDLGSALVGCSVLANGLRWNNYAGIGAGDRVAVLGPGPQGLACAAVAHRAGAKVIVIGVEHDSERLAAATRLGAEAALILVPGDEDRLLDQVREVFDEVDYVIEASGATSAKALATRLVRHQGTIVNVSVSASAPVDWMALLRKEVTIMHALSHPHTVEAALKLAVEMKNEGTKLGELITHRFDLSEAAHAIQVASFNTDERPIKVVLVPSLAGAVPGGGPA
ncbi:alcohol dehydrogenase catalytic domain-containing protein [Rhodococcus sp. DMU1]|uniref:zinc-dependent alcohol dehydrogenase n=1 Tax=Rhodococcus sp. DMU1 TaxID=2722825 RepID=UPI00143EBCF9|nr:alcohol dehydrogenase catalytic domain-containing protein [Rhodococcus sp. DMU1]QIX53680.1 alcohol dehydrogenase catalytic domain-containing protein [Rhodococcus sp. DMU1]